MRSDPARVQRIALHIDYFLQPPTPRIARAISYAIEARHPGCETVIHCATAPLTKLPNLSLFDLVVYALDQTTKPFDARRMDFQGAVVPTTFVYHVHGGAEAEAYAVIYAVRNNDGYEWIYFDFFPCNEVGIPLTVVEQVATSVQAVIDQRKRSLEPNDSEIIRASEFVGVLKSGLAGALRCQTEQLN